MEYAFETKLMVRDYECDIQGIVNNANYLHYTEHTRHLFLKHCGLSFVEMHSRGIDPVVARMSLQYKAPLRGDDEFFSRLALSRNGLRYVFHHDLYRASDNVLCHRAQVEVVCLINGKMGECDEFNRAFAQHIAKPQS